MARRSKATTPYTAQRLGEWLRSMRESKRLPLRVVAAAVEMDQAHLSKVELGQRMLTTDQANAIANFFSVDAKEMEARRLAEKFRFEYANNPAAEQAILMIQEDIAVYGAKR